MGCGVLFGVHLIVPGLSAIRQETPKAPARDAPKACAGVPCVEQLVSEFWGAQTDWSGGSEEIEGVEQLEFLLDFAHVIPLV